MDTRYEIRKADMAHSDCGWTCGCANCACKTVRSLENTCHTWALLRWRFTTNRCYIKCMQLYFYLYLYLYARAAALRPKLTNRSAWLRLAGYVTVTLMSFDKRSTPVERPSNRSGIIAVTVAWDAILDIADVGAAAAAEVLPISAVIARLLRCHDRNINGALYTDTPNVGGRRINRADSLFLRHEQIAFQPGKYTECKCSDDVRAKTPWSCQEVNAKDDQKRSRRIT